MFENFYDSLPLIVLFLVLICLVLALKLIYRNNYKKFYDKVIEIEDREW